MDSVELETRSLAQIIDKFMVVTKGVSFKSFLFYAIPHKQEGSGERLQGHHGSLV